MLVSVHERVRPSAAGEQRDDTNPHEWAVEHNMGQQHISRRGKDIARWYH